MSYVCNKTPNAPFKVNSELQGVEMFCHIILCQYSFQTEALHVMTTIIHSLQSKQPYLRLRRAPSVNKYE